MDFELEQFACERSGNCIPCIYFEAAPGAAEAARTVRLAGFEEGMLQVPLADNNPSDVYLNLPRYDGNEILRLTEGHSDGVTRYLQKPSSLDEFLGLGAILMELLGQRENNMLQERCL
jgi:hypothetical protein